MKSFRQQEGFKIMRINILLHVLVTLVLAVLFACQGCTVRFKASEVELDTVANQTYELESVSLFDG